MAGLALAALLTACSGAFEAPADAQVPPVPGQTGAPREDQPFKSPSDRPLEFRGPGREEPEPDVAEVVLGWFGPADPAHPEFGAFWQGAVLALEQENAAGGYRGKPFRLVSAWSESPWKAGVADVARLVHERGAWAVIGGVDGTTTHLAVQIALKSHLLLLSPGSTDVSTDRANVPWLFSLAPSDERQAPIVVEALADAMGGGTFVVAASTDHDAHVALVAFRREMADRRLTPAKLVEFDAGETDVGPLAERLLTARPRAALVLAPSRAAGRLVAGLRRAGFEGTIVGGATLARQAFRRAAGEAAEGVKAPRLPEPRAGWGAFARAYVSRWSEAPDDASAQGHDAVRLVADAIRKAGLNRARIRDAVRARAPWPGASGEVTWDPLGRNEHPVALGVWKGPLLASP